MYYIFLCDLHQYFLVIISGFVFFIKWDGVVPIKEKANQVDDGNNGKCCAQVPYF